MVSNAVHRWKAMGTGVAVLAFAWTGLVATESTRAAAGDVARAELTNTAGARVGEVVFSQIDGRVAVRAELASLPAGFHGFHVHDVGTCAGDFTSAGVHWNPTGTTHGTHVGDMPLLTVRSDGGGTAFFTTRAFTVQQLLDSDVAVIVHASSDNYANIPARYTSGGTPGPDSITNATGDAGGRLACGIVRAGASTLTAGYWLGGSRGGVYSFGDAGFFGSSAGQTGAADVVGIASTPSRRGYRLADESGGVFTQGDASFHGTAHGLAPSETFVGIAAPQYDAVAELVTTAGANVGWVGFAQEAGRVRVVAHAENIAPSGFHGFHVHDVGTCAGDFTSAGVHWNPTGGVHGGHRGDMPLLFAQPDNKATASFTTDAFTVQELLTSDVAVVVHASPDNYGNIPTRYTSGGTTGPDASTNATGDAGGRLLCGAVRAVPPGYWLAGNRGGVFTFGTPGFFGSPIGSGITEPIVGIAATPTGKGYWIAGSGGGVYAFGDAGFFGSGAGIGVPEPIVGITATPTGKGYWLLGARGGVYSFGDAGFFGSPAGLGVTEPMLGIQGTQTGAGYWALGARGGVYAFGDARFRGSGPGTGLSEPVIGLVLATG